jgi:FkbM family methyltransferase
MRLAAFRHDEFRLAFRFSIPYLITSNFPLALSSPTLQDNLLKNNCSQVEVIPYAISTGVDTHTLYIEENHSGASSLVPTDRSYDSIEISTVNEKYLNENLIIGNLRQIFVKIDVEGYEQTVLSVLQKWIYFHAVTKIFLEFDTYLSDVDKIKNLLISEGFQSEKRLGSSTHWDELYVRQS